MRYAKHALFIGTIAFFLNPFFANAFGISPPNVTAENLLKGSRYEAIVFLVRQDASMDIAVEAVFDVPEKIKNWITLDSGTYFIIPIGIQKFPVKVSIQIPEDEELGIYDGTIAFNTLPVRTEDQQVVISVGVGLGLHLIVGEGAILDFGITNINVLDIEEGDLPKIAITIKNRGNVPAAPDRATFDLFDKFGRTRLGFGQKDNEFPEVAPFETQTVVVEFPISVALAIGEYWGEAKVYRGDAVVGEMKTVFNVTEKRIPWALYGGIALAILIGIGGGIFAVKRVFRKHTEKIVSPLPARKRNTAPLKKTKKKSAK